MSASPEPLLSPGTMVDTYRVIRQVGRGGMGEVYLARDTKLGRRVALKIVIASALQHADARDRFLREARLTARFNHPHIITVYGVGQYQNMPYVALEFLEGETLGERLQVEQPGVKQGLRLALAVAEALAEAHDHDVLHRDLKPENVFIPRDGRIRVLDFGMAKRLEGAPGARERADSWEDEPGEEHGPDADNLFQTQTLGVHGTPLYMAPEQWFQRAGPASDVWALGVILRELFTGSHPFEGLTMNEVWARATEAVPLPSLAEAGAALPPALVKLADACVEKDGDRRPTAPQIVERLNELLSDIERRPTTDESPFRGLLPFQERHAHLFHGRQDEVGAFIERLRQTPVLPVVGPSGAGKSSFVQAGVVPRLREHGRWLVIRMRPGSTPFQTLANRLFSADSDTLRLSDFTGNVSGPSRRSVAQAETLRISASGGGDTLNADDALDRIQPVDDLDPNDDTERMEVSQPQLPESVRRAQTRILEGREPSAPAPTAPRFSSGNLPAIDAPPELTADSLRRYPHRLTLTLSELAEAESCRVLLVVDQLEELYTLVEDEEVRRAFMESLCTASDDPGSPVRVLFTLRDDFLWRLAEGAAAREVLGHVFVLRPPDDDALVETLTQPLRLLDYAFEDDDLPREMVSEVRAEPAALALLQFAAQQLWRKRDRDGHRLTREAYASIGGVAGALARHADGVLKALTPPQVDVARRLLLRLVTPDSTRRVCPRTELVEGLGWEAEETLERLIRERIVLSRKGRQGTELELVHESLIRTWRRLARWLEESRDERAFLDEVGQAATLWQRRGRPEHEVWQGDALADAARQAGRCSSLPEAVQAFLDAGRQRERRHIRRRKYLLIMGGAVLTLVAVVAVVVSFAMSAKESEARLQRDRARYQQAEAHRQKDRAERQRAETQLQRTEALREGARSALARGAFIEARAKLRGALLAQDSILSRALWGRLQRSPLHWKKKLNATLYSVAFSPSGRRVAAASSGQTVHLFSVDTGRETVLRGHHDQVYHLTYSPDGRTLASGTWSGEMFLWNLATGTHRELAGGGGGGGWALAFSPDGRLLASGGKSKIIELWDVATGKLQGQLVGHRTSIYGLAFSPDGKTLASASTDKTIRLWQVAKRRSVAVLRGHTRTVARVAFSPDGKTLASASTDRTVRLWSVAQRRVQKVLSGHQADVYGVAFSPDGRLLASSSHDRKIHIWRVADGARLGTIARHNGRIFSVSFSPNGKYLASTAVDSTLCLWKVAVVTKPTPPPSNQLAVMGAAFSPDGKMLATGGQDRMIRLWDRRTGQVLAALGGHRSRVNRVVFDHAGRQLASSSDDRTVRVWDLASRKKQVLLLGHRSSVFGLAFSPDGKQLVSGSSDHTLRIWNLDTGQTQRTLRGHTAPAMGVALSRDGRRIFSSSADSTLRVWDWATGRQLRVLRGHSPDVHNITLTPDGRHAATPTGSGTVRIWDLTTGTSKEMWRHPSRVYSLEFHPRGRLLATACADGIARIWDRVTQQVKPLRGHRGEVNHVTFSPDGRYLATTSDDHTLRLWSVRTGLPLWRTIALLRSRRELCTHRGWTRLAPAPAPASGTPKPTPSTAARRWRQAISKRARLATDSRDGKRLCLITRDGMLELWNMTTDRRVRPPLRGLAATQTLAALWNGCVTFGGGTLRYHGPSGPARVLLRKATAISAQGPELLAISGGQIHRFDTTGRVVARHPGGAGATALTRVGRWIALGYADGGMELVPLSPGIAAPSFSFEATASSAVVSLIPGPRGTLIAGYGDGTFGIWSVKTGDRLIAGHLHGPVVQLLLADQRLYAADELGEHRVLDLSVFYEPYCALLRKVWTQVPLRWEGGVPVRTAAPTSHRCTP